MEPFKILTIKLCEHESEYQREPVLYRGPIKEILGPWYSHFVDYYVCKNCMRLLKDATKNYDPNT